MALCPSGSTVNPSAPPYSWITWVEAQSFLGATFSKFSWLALLLQPVLVNTGAFCLTEPSQPAYPGDAVVAAASHDPAAFETIIQYLKDSATWFAWSQLCVCNASGTPGCLPSIMPHVAPTAGPWVLNNMEVGWRFQVAASGLTLWGMDVYCTTPGSADMYWIDVPTTVTNFTPVTLLAGWHRYYYSAPLGIVNLGTYQAGFRNLNPSATTAFGSNTGSPPTPAAPLALFGLKYGPANFSVINSNPDSATLDFVICASSPIDYAPPAPPIPITTLPDVPTSACTTIGDLCTLINPMTLQIDLLKQRLDLLQRRLLPFAWIAGTPVTGLTGHGQLTIQDVLGCIVTLTTVPGGWGSTAETPRRLIPTVGSLQASDGANYDDWRQIHYEHELYIFGTPWATKLNYNFRPGIVATVTPIQPEP